MQDELQLHCGLTRNPVQGHAGLGAEEGPLFYDYSNGVKNDITVDMQLVSA